ncbi:MAG TPA: hypothetical protein VOA87_06265 [Thermoanaerobaculia bacterium]|nr:hypothetical protein [Thermoanaerobaculia bacterium]
MKIAKILLWTALSLLAVMVFVRFFLSQLGSERKAEPAGVIQTAPAGFEVVERGELSPERAAAELETMIRERPTGSRVGIRFKHAGADLYWLADTGADSLEERSAGAAGTRLQTVWSGQLVERLRWARVHGDPAAPGLAPPQRHNLYH